MMKRYILMLVLSIIAIEAKAAEIQVANSESFESESNWSPKAFEALKLYFNAQEQAGYNRNSLETYRMLSRSDQSATTKADYINSDFPPQTEEVRDLILKNVTYDLRGFQSNSADSLTFTVEQTYPRLEESLYKELRDNWTQETNAKLVKYLSVRNAPLSFFTFKQTLIKEQDEWKISLGLADLNLAKQIYQNTEIPVERFGSYTGAQLVTIKDDLIYAKAELEKVLKLDSDHYSATSDLKRINELLKKLSYFEKYSKLIKIKELQVAKSTIGEDGIFGSIKNTSDQSFDTVQITFYYLDSAGKAIYEYAYKPVSDGIYSSSTPLKANYVKEFGIKAETPLGWSKKIKAVISDIEVSKK